MEMKKISLALIVIAALISVALAADLTKDIKDAAKAATSPKASAAPLGSVAKSPSSSSASPPDSSSSAQAPSPSGAASTMPVVGSLVGAFLMAFFGYYLQ